MDLYYLNGIERPATVDAGDLTEDGLMDLGKIKILQKIGQGIKKVTHAVNKVNPATALLRAGVLASMKLNVFGVAEKIRWSYLSDADAQKKNFNMSKFGKLKQVREKLEKIFYGAGGKPENLKEAILTGKGNASKEVSGLMGNEMDMPLRDVLGQRIFTSEIESLEGLGEPATGAALAAASAIMASLAALIKSIGNLKGNDSAATPDANVNVTDVNLPVTTENLNLDEFNIPSDESYSESTPGTSMQTRSATITETDEGGTNTNKSADAGGDKPSWWENNKKWALPTGIVIGVAGLGFAAYKVSHKPNKGVKKGKKGGDGLSGIHRSKRKKKKYSPSKKKKVRAVRWS